LALSEQSIASITLSSPKLLTTVLEIHRPDVIITDGTFLPHVLKLVYDADEHHHKVIVVGKSESNLKPKAGTEVETYSWNEIESSGKVPQAPKNAPRMPFISMSSLT
jgi:long-chain acyl-CoA synthetase